MAVGGVGDDADHARDLPQHDRVRAARARQLEAGVDERRPDRASRARSPARSPLSLSGHRVQSLVDSVHRRRYSGQCPQGDQRHDDHDGTLLRHWPPSASGTSRPHGGREVAVFSRLATFLDANARRVLAVAVLAAAVAGAFGFGVANDMSPYGADDPASESVQATHRFEHAAGRQIDAGVVALVRAGEVRSAPAKARVGQVAAQLRAEPDVARVVSYYDTSDRAMVSRDGRSTYVLAYFKPRSDKTLEDAAKQIETSFSPQRDVKLGGQAVANRQVNSQVGEDLGRAEVLAFPFIFVLSLLFFRSLVAALLPPLVGALTIVATFFALRVLASFTDLSVFALNLVTGLGLGLAIDYSLFMVSRYREEAATSGFGLTALRRTIQTAGRTIVFSSLTIAAAIASLTIFPQRFLYSMGIGGALVALLAASLALVVLPAVLIVLGPRVNALAPSWLAR